MKKPNPILIEYVDQLKPGSVLDLGSGDGTNVAFLDSKGFEVDWVEKNYGSTIEEKIAQTTDIKEDNIISLFTLHFLKPSDAKKTYKWMKDHTASGGVNIISHWLKNDDWKNGYYLDPEQLRETYGDWIILNYEEKEVMTYSGSTQMAAFVVAKKP